MSTISAPDSPAFVPSSSPARPKPPRAPRDLSAVTNGGRLHVVQPRNTAWARRWRDVHNQILRELEHANPNGLTEQLRHDARVAVTMIVACERVEGRVAAGEDIDHDEYGKLSDRLGRIYRRLGLGRSNDTEAAPGPLGKILSEGLNK
jgi:hypothetical protein